MIYRVVLASFVMTSALATGSTIVSVTAEVPSEPPCAKSSSTSAECGFEVSGTHWTGAPFSQGTRATATAFPGQLSVSAYSAGSNSFAPNSSASAQATWTSRLRIFGQGGGTGYLMFGFTFIGDSTWAGIGTPSIIYPPPPITVQLNGSDLPLRSAAYQNVVLPFQFNTPVDLTLHLAFSTMGWGIDNQYGYATFGLDRIYVFDTDPSEHCMNRIGQLGSDDIICQGDGPGPLSGVNYWSDTRAYDVAGGHFVPEPNAGYYLVAAATLLGVARAKKRIHRSRSTHCP